MIKNKEFKISETPQEDLWEKTKKTLELDIKELKRALIVNEAFLEMTLRKLKEIKK